MLAREPLANGYLSGRHRPGTPIAGPDDWRSARDRDEVDADLERAARLQASEVPAGVPLARWRSHGVCSTQS